MRSGRKGYKMMTLDGLKTGQSGKILQVNGRSVAPSPAGYGTDTWNRGDTAEGGSNGGSVTD